MQSQALTAIYHRSNTKPPHHPSSPHSHSSTMLLQHSHTDTGKDSRHTGCHGIISSYLHSHAHRHCTYAATGTHSHLLIAAAPSHRIIHKSMSNRHSHRHQAQAIVASYLYLHRHNWPYRCSSTKPPHHASSHIHVYPQALPASHIVAALMQSQALPAIHHRSSTKPPHHTSSHIHVLHCRHRHKHRHRPNG